MLHRPHAELLSPQATYTASYEVETHGPRKLLSLLDHEFAESGSCLPKATPKVLLQLPSLEVWDGAKQLGPVVARTAQVSHLLRHTLR